MKNIICLLLLVVFSLSSYSCVTKDKGSSDSISGTPTWGQAVYCNIESAQV